MYTHIAGLSSGLLQASFGSLQTLHVTEAETLSSNGIRKLSTLLTNLHKFTYEK
jgi:hypothetical protein